MRNGPERRAARSVSRFLLPESNPAGTIYGTLTVGVLLAVESTVRQTAIRDIGAVLAALVTYWLAHAYASDLAHRVSTDEAEPSPGVVAELGRQWTIIRGALIPLVAFAITLLIGASTAVAVTVALITSIAMLVVFEAIAAVRGHLGFADLAKQVLACVLVCVFMLAIKFTL